MPADPHDSTTTRPTLAARLCRRFVRLYPRAWRRRYEDEVLDVVDQRNVGWRDCGDVARGAVTEWTSPRYPTLAGERDMRDAAIRMARTMCKAFAVLCVVGVVSEFVFLLASAVGYSVVHPEHLGWRFFLGFGQAAVARALPIQHPAQWLLWDVARFGYGLLGAAPVALVLAWTGIGRRWPLVARLSSVTAFLWLDLWLVHSPVFGAQMAVSGWVVFAAVFARPAAVSPDVRGAVPRAPRIV